MLPPRACTLQNWLATLQRAWPALTAHRDGRAASFSSPALPPMRWSWAILAGGRRPHKHLSVLWASFLLSYALDPAAFCPVWVSLPSTHMVHGLIGLLSPFAI